MEGEDDGKHDAPSAASSEKDRQVSPFKIGEYASNHLIGGMERVGTEEDPQESHKTEGQ